MKRIKISMEADCAKSSCCFPKNGRLEQKQKWIDDNDLFVDASKGRAFALVDTVSRVYFMDAITGSLYQFGNCMTSSILRVQDLHRDKYAAEQFLLRLVETEVVALADQDD